MTNTEFKCWLNGFLVLTDDVEMNPRQVTIIKNHAHLVEAISKNLDDNIKNFILFLEKSIENKTGINLLEIKQYVMKNNLIA